MADLLDRYADKIAGVLGCYDRVLLSGTLPGLCYAKGMELYLRERGIRLFDYPRWAEPLRDLIRENAEQLAKDAGLEIEFVRKQHVRKEELVAKVLRQRGDHPGFVHILSAMEECQTYQPWHDKKTGKTFLRPDSGRCLHYYFYFIDEELGLCFLRVPTWAPFRLQFYFNGHNLLAAKLRRRGIGFTLRDNAFVAIDDFARAQRLVDEIQVKTLHRTLDRWALKCCPVLRRLGVLGYHWSIMQSEYATDVVFRRQADLAPIYETLVRTAIHAVKPDHVATFLGRKLDDRYRDELGNDFSTRIEGTRIRHHMGPVSIKMYDKFGLVLRIETTVNDATFFKHHRKVEQRDGNTVYKLAPVKKSIYSLAPDLSSLLSAANQRYLDFLSDLDDPSTGIKALHTISQPTTDANGRAQRGFNLFLPDDEEALRTLIRGEFTISGFRNRDLKRHLASRSSAQISALLRRLRSHGVIRRIGRTYKYYVTALGRHVTLAGLKLKELVVIPALATPATV